MSGPKSYVGNCVCGAVEFTVTGEPASMGYCHCSSCRHWSAGPVNAFTLWQPESVKITRGEGNIGTYAKTPQSYRKWIMSTRCAARSDFAVKLAIYDLHCRDDVDAEAIIDDLRYLLETPAPDDRT